MFVLWLAVGLGRGAAQQTLDWDAVTKLAPGTAIWVTSKVTDACVFEKTEGDTLYCNGILSDDDLSKPQKLSFQRTDVQSVQVIARRQYGKLDHSSGWYDFVFAAGGGAAADTHNQPNFFGGIKVGRSITLNLNYDCIGGHKGFGLENAGMIPLARFPRFVPGRHQDFARLYLEPGVGYRFGQGTFGAYTSAGALIQLRKKSGAPSPYIEYTHRFPFGSPWQGDNRIAFGIMIGDDRDSSY